MEFYNNVGNNCYPEQMVMMMNNYPGHQDEYLSTLNTYKNSFDQGYYNVNNTSNPYNNLSTYFTNNSPMERVVQDTDASSDSGVTEDYQSDVSPIAGSHTPISYQASRDYLRERKPLSAWKLKQLRLTPAGVKKRRKDANARERKRMNGLNDAFERLRDAVPGTEEEDKDKNKKLSKMDTLQMANLYIRHLVSLLNSPTVQVQAEPDQ